MQGKPKTEVEKEYNQSDNSSVKTSFHESQDDSSSQLSDINMTLNRTISNSSSGSITTVGGTVPSESISDQERAHSGADAETAPHFNQSHRMLKIVIHLQKEI